MSNQLSAGERVLLSTRPHVLTVLAPAIGYLVLLGLVLAATLYAAHAQLIGIKSYPWIPPVVILLFALVRLLPILVRWLTTSFTLTNNRVIYSRGIFSRTTTSMTLDRVQDTTVRQDFLQRWVAAGDVEIESAGRDGAERLHMVPKAQQFSGAVQDAMALHNNQGPSLGPRTV